MKKGLIILVIALAALTGCSTDMESEIPGIWSPVANGTVSQKGDNIDFYSDHTLVMKIILKRRPLPYKGTWVVLNDETVKLDVKIAFAHVIFTGKIQDDKLVLKTTHMEQEMIYKKQ